MGVYVERGVVGVVEGVEAQATARGCWSEAYARDVERLSRARAYDAIVDEERYALGETYSYSVASASTSVDERWRMGGRVTRGALVGRDADKTREWTRLRVVFDGLVAHVDGEVECERLVRDDARWREMKMTMDDPNRGAGNALTGRITPKGTAAAVGSSRRRESGARRRARTRRRDDASRRRGTTCTRRARRFASSIDDFPVRRVVCTVLHTSMKRMNE